MSEGQAARVMRQLLSALAHLHQRRLVHGDIKPENILFETRWGGAQMPRPRRWRPRCQLAHRACAEWPSPGEQQTLCSLCLAQACSTSLVQVALKSQESPGISVPASQIVALQLWPACGRLCQHSCHAY